MRSALAKQQGLDETLVAQLADHEHGAFTPREKLALRLAETIARDPNGLAPELRTALHAEFTDAQIVELAFAAAMFFGAGRMVAAMGLTLATEREHAEEAR